MPAQQPIPNAFIGRKDPPTGADLAEVLKPNAKAAWDRWIADLAEEHGVTTLEWRSSSTKNGWAARMLRGKRTIVWMAPLAGGAFEILFVLGDKALAAARGGGALSKHALSALDAAKRYPEGSCVRLNVKNTRDLATLSKLVAAKIAN